MIKWCVWRKDGVLLSLKHYLCLLVVVLMAIVTLGSPDPEDDLERQDASFRRVCSGRVSHSLQRS